MSPMCHILTLFFHFSHSFANASYISQHCSNMYVMIWNKVIRYYRPMSPTGIIVQHTITWWRHQMETLSASLALCVGNSPVIGEFPTQRPVTRSFGAFFDLRVNKRLGKQPFGWWIETPSCSLWRHYNDIKMRYVSYALGSCRWKDWHWYMKVHQSNANG